nr:CoA transferase [uncultured Acetatifactor sp.]
MERPELLKDERFDCNNNRVIYHAQLKPIIEEWLQDKKIDDTVEKLLAVGIPTAPLLSQDTEELLR